ncbi:MAG: FAD-dependent oxidoreductase, partial [Phycisphaerae bacterium]|nr:FAD-dependent oxidoreductase [Phycisphaerae bacterium]
MAESGSKVRLLVVGGGPGGYPAAFLAADLGLDVTMVDTDERPGGVCLHRGCIPSKALLHVARFLNEVREASEWGVHLAPPRLDIDELRDWKNKVVDRLTAGLVGIREKRGLKFIHGHAKLADPHAAIVTKVGGGQERVEFDYCILATGSAPVRLPFMPNDPRVMDSTSALEIRDIPERLLVIGGGYIGLELSTAYAAFGSKVTLAEKATTMLPGSDRDIVDFLARRLTGRLDQLLLDTRVVAVTAEAAGLRVQWAGLHVDHPV